MLVAVQNLRIEYGIWQECSFNVTNFVRIDLLLVHKRTSLTDDIFSFLFPDCDNA